MGDESLTDIMNLLSQIENDSSVPKNVRIKIKNAYVNLGDCAKSIAVRKDKSMQELDDISDYPNVPSYVRTQIWNIVSLLENISE